MKRLLSALILCLLSASQAFAVVETKTVMWDPVNGAVGYRYYCGLATGTYAPSPVFDLTGSPVMNTKIVQHAAPGTYFCALRAYNNIDPDSPYSNEVTYSVARMALDSPKNLRVTTTIGFDPVLNKFVATVEVEGPAEVSVDGVPVPTL